MSLTRAIYERSVFFFLAILLFSFWGFWYSYFAILPEAGSAWAHVHGLAMYGWMLLLILQASLIRMKKRDLHRATGKLSILLVPLIIVTTIFLAHERLLAREMADVGIFILGLGFLGLVPFTLFYLLAMLNRKTPDVHARWMVCTGITLIDPVFARIIGFNFVQVPFESGLINAITYGAMAVLTLGLAAVDYRQSGRKDVFLPAFLIMAILQFSFLLFWNGPAWRGFAAWYASLPLG